MADFESFTPKKIGNFNVPKSVIECKVDTLAILELLLRKNIATWEEIDEIREAVVLHLNVLFPELQLTYSTPQPLKDEAPIPGTEPAAPPKPLFYSAPPPEFESMKPTVKEEPKVKPTEQSPLHYTNQPKVAPGPRPMQSGPRGLAQQQAETTSEKPVEEKPAETAEQIQPKITPSPNAPKPMMPTAGPPKILSNPPRKKF